MKSACALICTKLLASPCRAAEKPAKKPADKPGVWRDLFDGKSLEGWKVPKIGGEGEVAVKDGAIVIGAGESMSGLAYKGELPKLNYEIELEAMRTKGADFFATTTFPVADSSCSFVLGGWGGTTVGLSSIDFYDASDNSTSSMKAFDDKRWYRVRIRVTAKKIETWIDDEKIVDFVTVDHKIGIRFECDPYRPLGICTWCTEGRVRKVRLRSLTAADIADVEADVARQTKDQ
jgi:hypothetical protein